MTTAGPPRAPMVAAFTIFTAVTLELVLIEIAVHSRITLVIGITLTLAAVLGLALTVAALVAVGSGVQRLRQARQRRADDRTFQAIAAELRPPQDGDGLELARAFDVLNEDNGWPW